LTVFFTKVSKYILKKLTVLTVDSFFQHFFHNNDTRSTMSEPAKDTAIEITPKTETSSVRVPRIVAEINRVASRVRDRNKKEEEDNDDAEVLENDLPTPSQRPVDIKIIRENTHRPRVVDRVIVGLLIFISILLLIGCVLLGVVLMDDRTKASPSPPPPSPPPLKLPSPPPLQISNTQYKTIWWNTGVAAAECYQLGTSFTEVMKNEGVTENEISNCNYETFKSRQAGWVYNGCEPLLLSDYYGWTSWYLASNESRTCVFTIVLGKLLQENWKLIGVPQYDNVEYGSMTFTKTYFTEPQNSNPPKCVPPGGDKLRFDGTSWSCVCERGWTGSTCETGPTTPIPDASFKTFLSECLASAPYDGECRTWHRASTYGTIPWWNTSLVTNMFELFASSIFNGDITKWDTSSVTSMERAFQSNYAFNGDISKWDTGKVTSMYIMFYEASAFNQDIGSWNTAQVTDMRYMFGSATSFNHYVGDWDTSPLSSYSNIFNGATAFRAKYTCAPSGTGTQEQPDSHKPSWCKTVRSDWVAPPPPPSS
jgi:surface protein